MTLLQIVYNLQDRCVSIDTLVRHPYDYKEYLSDAEQINCAWIQVSENNDILHGAQPLSLSVFLALITKYFRFFLSGKCIWLYGLEADFVFQASTHEMEFSIWPGVTVDQLRPFIFREIARGILFEMRDRSEELPRYCGMPFNVRFSLKYWLATILCWGRQFSQLVRETKSWIAANPANAAPDFVQHIQETDWFLTEFQQCEGDIAATLAAQEMDQLLDNGV